jgi:predicted phosphoadenosine phosphosulfate sulfurtransferase
MYKQKYKLTTNEIESLVSLKNEVNLENTSVRLGISGTDNLSVYTVSKWKSWNRNQKIEFKKNFPVEIIDKSVVGWYLHIPSKTGFLDLMTTWMGQKTCGTIFAYALEDNQAIILDGEQVTVNRGESVKFNLSVPHEIKQGNSQTWACVMLMVNE